MIYLVLDQSPYLLLQEPLYNLLQRLEGIKGSCNNVINDCAQLEKMKSDLCFIKPTEEQKKECKIILGQSAYKQKLGNTELKVLPKHQTKHYINFSEVAFLVTDWIKIQDSLEMIFNLLVGPSHSLYVLNYLKTQNISPECFAEYLAQEHSIYLFNSKNQISHVTQFINKTYNSNSSLNYTNYHVLYVGNQTPLPLPSHIPCEHGQAIHCSGVNLNKYSIKYNNTWYLFKDSELKDKTNNFSFQNFRIV